MSNDIRKTVSELPDTPGVYRFLDASGHILYIGKATSLKDRVKSYFGDDLMATRGQRLVDMVTLAQDIQTESTLSVLEALILEAKLIQKHQPKYNSIGKDDKTFNHVVITKEKFPRIVIMREKDLDELPPRSVKYSFGPFPQGGSLRIALEIIRRIFPYRDEKCIPAEDQIKAGKEPRACFNRHIRLCPGVCTGEIHSREYSKIVNNIKLFFEGKKGTLIKKLEHEMNSAAKKQAFERAAELRRQIFSLDHINDIALIRDDLDESAPDSALPTSRIEAYDIAHLGGTNTVGVMVVVEDGTPKRSDYRKFKIRGLVGKVHDPKNLQEILTRRFKHTEWPLPNLIVVDGNDIQINAAREVVKNYKLDIDVVSVVKDARHKARDIIGPGTIVDAFRVGILRANAEAHRFAIAYHRHLRSKRFAG